MLKNFEKRFEHFFQTIAAASSRRPLVFVGIGLALCALSLYLLSQMPFLTSRTALLDRTSPEVERFEHYMENFGAASDLIIAIEGIERPELEKYAAELASRLEELPEVSAADSRLDLNFFVSHAYTILPCEQFDKAATFMDGLLSMDGKMPSSLDEALDAANRYFEEPPAIPMGEIDMDSARASLNGMQFFLDEWLRWLEPDSTDGGWHAPETAPDGTAFRWSSGYAWQRLPAGTNSFINIPMYASNIQLRRWPLRVAVYVNRRHLDTVTFTDKRWKNYRYPLPADVPQDADVLVEFVPSRTWVPRHYGFDDSRALGVAVGTLTCE